MFGDYEDHLKDRARYLLDQNSLSDILSYFGIEEEVVLTLLLEHGIIEVPVLEIEDDDEH